MKTICLLCLEIKKQLWTRITLLMALALACATIIPAVYTVWRYKSYTEEYFAVPFAEAVDIFREEYELMHIYFPLDNSRPAIVNLFFQYYQSPADVDERDQVYFEYYPVLFSRVNNARAYRNYGTVEFLPVYIFNDTLMDDRRVYSYWSVKGSLESAPPHSFAARDYGRQLAMMDEVGEPELVYIKFWEIWEGHQVYAGLIIAGFTVVLLLRAMESENRGGIRSVLSSTAGGKRGQYLHAFLAALIIGAAAIALQWLAMYLICIVGGGDWGREALLHSLSMPDVRYALCPYALTIAGYFALRPLIQIFTLAMVLSMAMLLFTLTKSFLPSALGTLIAVGAGRLLYRTAGVTNLFTLFSPFNGLCPQWLLYKYESFNLLGFPVLYPSVYLAVMALLTALCLAVGKWISGRYVC